jgi:hypothetical protein
MPTTAPSSDCIPTAEFIYNKGDDFYLCPASQQMKQNGKPIHRKNYLSYVYKTSACQTCPIRQECTQNKAGRTIERSQYQDIIDENMERVLASPDYYKLRQQIIEHQFGILKRQWGFTFTLLRGKVGVMSEVNLLMIVYNLTRMISIIGINEFKRRMGVLSDYFLSFIATLETNWKDYINAKLSE